MIRLSVVIITFNEEKNIGRCLDSVREIADEIVVVDSFSTDGTQEICLRKGARFLTHRFEGHIQQKNYAITQASSPYILSLDADEALSERLLASIKAVKSSWEHDGYYVNRLNNYCGDWIRHGGWYPDRKLRLFDSRKGSWKGKNPHDRYEMQTGSRIARIEGDLLHYSFYTVQGHLQQVKKFTTIASREVSANPLSLSLKMLLSPPAKFFRDYIFRLGFLDGKAGFLVASISAWASFLKYAKALRP
jgi:glycosyltransferase involved in cell wall biosynthesis